MDTTKQTHTGQDLQHKEGTERWREGWMDSRGVNEVVSCIDEHVKVSIREKVHPGFSHKSRKPDF